MRQLILILVLFISFNSLAQNETIFENATEAYNNGSYQEAIDLYNSILDNGNHSAELYFNLGNAHYKLNQIAPSIYNYEKALLLSPADSEIKNNLSYAQNMTLDAIEVLPETGLAKFYKAITDLLTFDQWSYLGITFMLLFVLLYIAFYFFSEAHKKRISFISSFAFLIASLLCIVFAFVQYTDYKTDQPAIIFANEIKIKAEPNTRSESIFILHEGTKVQIVEELNDWQKIRLVDGKTGWLPSENLKSLKDF